MREKKKVLQALFVVCAAFVLIFAVKKADQPGSVQIYEETVTMAGIRRSYDFFLIADTHISLCDDRDPGLIEKAQTRREAFARESKKTAVRTFHNLITQSNRNDTDLTIFAGDITDSAMYASIDFVQKETERLSMPYLYVTGNHDFEYGWVFHDNRLHLASGSDENLLKFLCEMFHPLVRSEESDWEGVREDINNLLRIDGYEIYESEKISGRSVFSYRYCI